MAALAYVLPVSRVCLDALFAADFAEFGVDRLLVFSISTAIRARAVVTHVGARSFESVVAAVRATLPTVTTVDAHAFFAAAGFSLP